MDKNKTHLALMIVLGLFCTQAYSEFRVQRAMLYKSVSHGQKSDEDCGMRSTNGKASQLQEINCMINPMSCVHKAAWYQDRDNSMTPVSTKEGVGSAMATFWTLTGFSQGIQVCPGVYLATAHGVLDDPEKAKKEGRPLISPFERFFTTVAYPMNPSNGMRVSSNSQFISPRIGNPYAWKDLTKDYVFVKVDNPIRPNHFVRPVIASDRRLVEASRRGEIDVHLYRPQTRFDTDKNGTPIFSKGFKTKEVKDVELLYQAPLKVNQPCDLVEDSWGIMGHSCSTEQSISGSSQVTRINGEDYLVGMHIQGDPKSYDHFSDDKIPNGFVQSKHFCKDYESVCGEPCVELDDVLPKGAVKL